MSAFKARYGASPVHLVAHLGAMALAGWALLQVVDIRAADDWLLWFVGAAVLHDLAFVPLYSAIDRLVQRLPMDVNVLRVPAIVSGVLLLVSFPRILDRQPGNVERVSGMAPDGYLQAWLLITAGLFAVSLAWWVVRGARAVRAGDDDAAA